MYEKGAGVLADKTTAAKWYQKSAELGNANAMVNLAGLYNRGEASLRTSKPRISGF
jgi:TPR repeat protein